MPAAQRDINEFRWRASSRRRQQHWPWAALSLVALGLVASVLSLPDPTRGKVQAAGPPRITPPAPAVERQPAAAPVRAAAAPAAAPVAVTTEQIPVIAAVRPPLRTPGMRIDVQMLAATAGAPAALQDPAPPAAASPARAKPRPSAGTAETRVVVRSYERTRTSSAHLPSWAAKAFGTY